MFVDELEIYAEAGSGGDGVVRWLRERARPKGGPAGGNGGKGGDVFVRAVRDLNILARYRHEKEFRAEDGTHGASRSCHGKGGADLVIDVPVGAKITDLERGYVYALEDEGVTEKILRGGNGGLGNEYFKSSTNRRPEQSTPGGAGERGTFRIELELVADVGLIGYPNAGKSSLLNALTNATSKIGAYAFTTVEPHLGNLYGFIVADIPGLIEGASEGKGLGHKFLRHIRKTRMLLHCISSEESDPLRAYHGIREEIEKFDATILDKPEWVILTKADTITPDEIEAKTKLLEQKGVKVVPVSVIDDTLVKQLSDELVATLRGK